MLRLLPLAAALLFLNMSGCDPGCGICCGDGPAPAISVRLTYCSLEVTALDNRGEYPVVAANNAVPRAALGLRLGLESKQEICGWPAFDFSFATAAYACSPVINYELISLDSIEQVVVTTVYDYSPVYAAGSDVSAEVRVLAGRGFISLESYLDLEERESSGLSQDSTGAEVGQQLIDLLFAAPATLGDRQQFRVVMRLSDGRALEALSPEITVF